MQFYNPSVTFKGSVICENAPSNDNDLVRKQDVSDLSFINGIASGSSSMLTVTDGELAITNIALTDVHVDNTQTSLANFVANESSTAAGLKEGDVLILTAPSDGTETYIVSGADGSATGNYTQIESPLTAAEVGSVIQAGDGISINSSTAQISANLAAGTGLQSSVSNGQITFALNADSDQISEGSTNLFYTNARSRNALSVATVSAPEVQLLQYNSSTGAFSVELSDVFNEFTAGTGLSYSNGEYSLNATTDDVSEGSNNLYYTDARVRSAISVSSNSDELIAYNSGNGQFSLRASDLRYEASVTLTANVASTITHNLGKRLVHVSAMDASGNKVELSVVYSSTSALTVTSAVGVTVDIAVSI